MRILIDGDGCPVVHQAVALAQKYNLECQLFCDEAHEFFIEGIMIKKVQKGSDSVDFALVNMIIKDDIVITQDYGLAAMCLARGALPLNQNGIVFDSANMDVFLYARHEAKKARNTGLRVKGPKKRTKEQDAAFIRALENLITTHLNLAHLN